MIRVFQQAKYKDDFPLHPDEIAVEGITVKQFYDYYWIMLMEDIKEVYANEWIIKQYLIYYLRAPGINKIHTANFFEKHFWDFDLARMLLLLDNIYINPFEL